MRITQQLRGVQPPGPEVDQRELDHVVTAFAQALRDPAAVTARAEWVTELARHLPALLPPPRIAGNLLSLRRNMDGTYQVREAFYVRLLELLTDQVDRDDGGLFLQLWSSLRALCLYVMEDAPGPVGDAARRLGTRLDHYMGRMRVAGGLPAALEESIAQSEALVRSYAILQAGVEGPERRSGPILLPPGGLRPGIRQSSGAYTRPDRAALEAGLRDGEPPRPTAMAEFDTAWRNLLGACARCDVDKVRQHTGELVDRVASATAQDATAAERMCAILDLMPLAYRRGTRVGQAAAGCLDPLVDGFLKFTGSAMVRTLIGQSPDWVQGRLETLTADLLQATSFNRPEIVGPMARFLVELSARHADLPGVENSSGALTLLAQHLGLGDACREVLTRVVTQASVPDGPAPALAALRAARRALGGGDDALPAAGVELGREEALRFVVQQALLAGDLASTTREALLELVVRLRLSATLLNEIISQEREVLGVIEGGPPGTFRKRRALAALLDVLYHDGEMSPGEKEIVVMVADALGIPWTEVRNMARDARHKVSRRLFVSSTPELSPDGPLGADVRAVMSQCRARRRLSLLWATSEVPPPPEMEPRPEGSTTEAVTVQLLTRPKAWPHALMMVYTNGEGEGLRARARGRLLEPVVHRSADRCALSVLNRNTGGLLFPPCSVNPADLERFAQASLEEGLYFLAFVRLPDLGIVEVKKVRQTVDCSGSVPESLRMMTEEDGAGALPLLTALLDQQPRLRGVRARLGDCLRLEGDVEGARRRYEEEIAEHAESPDAWTGLGLLAKQQGDTLKAIEHFRKAVEVDDMHLSALLGLASMLTGPAEKPAPGRAGRISGRFMSPTVAMKTVSVGDSSPGVGAAPREALKLVARAYSLYPRSDELRFFLREHCLVSGVDAGSQVRVLATPLRYC